MLEAINEIFTQKFFDDFEKVESLLLKYSELVDKIGTKSIKDLGLKELTQATAALTKANTSLNNAYNALNSQSVANAKAADLNAAADLKAAKAADVRTKTATKLANESSKASKQIQRDQKEEAKIAAELINDYGLLSKAYLDAALRAKNYSLQLGENAPVTLEAVAAANKMGETLKRLDASVGQHNRNVGNYASAYSGLNMSIQQILREAPSAAVSLNTFFLAISNNLPMFFDELAKINKEVRGLSDVVKTQTLELAKQTTIQKEAAAAQDIANKSLTRQIGTAVEGLAVTKEQQMALKRQITEQVKATAATAEAAAVTIANTEALLLSSGASAQETAALRLQMEATLLAARASAEATVALQAQTIATAEAAAAARKTSVWAQVGRSLFSLNTLLTAGVLILTLYGGKIIDWIKRLGDAKAATDALGDAEERSAKKREKAMRSMTKTQKELLDATEKATEAGIKNAAQEQVNAEILYRTATDINSSMKTRISAVEELQRIYPGYFKDLSKEAILAGDAAAAYNELTQAITARISLEVYQDELKTLQQQSREIDKQIKLLGGYNQALNVDRNLPKQAPGSFRMMTPEEESAATKAAINDEKVLALSKQQQDIQTTYNRTLADSVTLRDQLYKLTDKTEKVTDTSARDLKRLQNERDRDRSAEIAAEKELSDAKRDLNNETLEQQIQGFKLVYENEALAYDDRLVAYGKYNDARQKQILANRDKELTDIKEIERQIKEVQERPEKERSQADNDLLLRVEGIATRRKVIEAKTQADIVELHRKSAQEITRIMETSSDARLRESANALRIIREQEDDNFRKVTKDLGNRLLQGKIKLKEYNKEIKKAELQSATDTANAQIAALYNVLLTTELSADARAKIEKQLADIKAKLTDDEIKQVQATEAEKIALIEKRRDAAINAGAAVIQAAFDIESYRYDKELESLDEKSRLLDENLKKELAGIEALGLAEAEKQQRIADANGRAAAAEAAIERDRRKAIIARARTEKGAKIASIILTTSQAVIQAFAEGDPFTKAVRAAAAGIAGATQLAIAAATPIPAYADGTDDKKHPGGPAIINDNKKYGNEAELIEEPGKAPYWADYKTDTLVNLPKGSSVTPLHKIVQGAQLATMAALSQSGVQKVSEHAYIEMLMAQVNAGLAKLDKTIRDKPETRFIGTERGIKAITKQGNSEEERINDITH